MKPEDKILDALCEVWNEFQNVENKHPDDNNEFRFHIHALQNLLYAHKYKMEVQNNGMYNALQTPC